MAHYKGIEKGLILYLKIKLQSDKMCDNMIFEVT